MSRYDRLAIFRGAAFGLLLGAPATLLNSSLSGEDGSDSGLALSFVGVLLGFLLAGFVAGANAPGEAARHGALAGLVAFVPIEVLALLGRFDRGAPIRLGGIILLALLGAWIGSLGGMLGARRRRTEPSSTPQEGP